MTRSVVLLMITRFSVIHCTKLPMKVEITNMEKALNVWRKNACHGFQSINAVCPIKRIVRCQILFIL